MQDFEYDQNSPQSCGYEDCLEKIARLNSNPEFLHSNDFITYHTLKLSYKNDACEPGFIARYIKFSSIM